MSDQPTHTVTFKHEDEQGGQAIGPVWVIDHIVHDPYMVETYGEDWRNKPCIVPYGTTIPGELELGWKTLSEARKIAAQYGVELNEG